MARGINKVILIGNLGDEPLCRTTHSGVSVTNISMVTNEFRRNLETGESTEYPEWHRVVMWGRLADIAKQYLHKGSQVYIEGKLRTRSYMDKQGQKRSITEVVADEMQMLSRNSYTAPTTNGPGYPPADDGIGGGDSGYSGSDQGTGYASGNYGQNSYGSQGGYSNYGSRSSYNAGGYSSPRPRQPSVYQNPSGYNNNQNGYGQRANPYPQSNTQGSGNSIGGGIGSQNNATGTSYTATPAPTQEKADSKDLQEPSMKMDDDEIPF